MTQGDDEKLSVGIYIVIAIIIVVILFIVYLYQKNTSNFIDYNQLNLYRIQHVKSGKFVVIRQVILESLIGAPPSTNDITTSPYVPVLVLSDDPSDALGVWELIPSSKTSDGQRWTMNNDFTKKYLTSINGLAGRPQSYSYICNSTNPPSRTGISQQHIYLDSTDPSFTETSVSLGNGLKRPSIPSRFKIMVESKDNDNKLVKLPLYRNPPTGGNTDFSVNALVINNDLTNKHEGDEFALRVPVINI